MKKHTTTVASLILLLMFALTSAWAQTKITVKVPFDFRIANKEFPAGQYSVSASRDHLIVENKGGKVVFVGIANSVDGRQVGNTGQLIFHCYESNCFLSEFWTPTRDTGSQLLRSRYEAELAGHQKGTVFALLEEKQK